MHGYAGKILLINLTTKEITVLNTSDYEEWGGGHGIGSKLFWDLVKDKTISAFDPANVVTVMSSPLSGTMVPGASSRTEVQGIGAQTYPEWFTRSNFGGRFSAMLKYAGWDGIAVTGKASKPVWIDIRNDDVQIRDADGLWGEGTWETQKKIWEYVTGEPVINDWLEFASGETAVRTTQRPAVLTIGPAGETLSRMACLIHDAGAAAGQGGFGAVWGSKNLKAVSVIGTGSITIADPDELLSSRLWAQREYGNDLYHPEASAWTWFGVDGKDQMMWKTGGNARLHACIGCHRGCHERSEKAFKNESMCSETYLFVYAGQEAINNDTEETYRPTYLAQSLGLNANEIIKGYSYIKALYQMGVMGPGKEIDCDLPFDKLDTLEFMEKLYDLIISRKGVGDDMAEGFYRAAKRWGRLEKDLGTNLLYYAYWGMPTHSSYDPRAEVHWGYGTILGDREINEHDFCFIFWKNFTTKGNPPLDAETLVKIVTEKMEPYNDDPFMLDANTENIYSDHVAKLVSWHRHYTRFWKESALYCDNRWPDFVNTKAPDNKGLTGEGEQRFYNAVTGKNFSFADGVALGKKIWNLDNAIWTLQGRHRDMVRFEEFIYKEPFVGRGGPDTNYILPWFENGTWSYRKVNGRFLDKQKVEEFKTRFYTLEGWDVATGWPKRSTLESIGLDYVADELEEKGKLGAP